jgi:hypothetical protein
LVSPELGRVDPDHVVAKPPSPTPTGVAVFAGDVAIRFRRLR